MNNKTTEQIQSFITKTQEGRIDWVFLNANAVRFTKTIQGRVYTITLQNQGGGAPHVMNYIFTVQSANPNEVMLQIQTQNSPQYRELIKTLFDISMSASQNKASEDIDNLLNEL